MSSTASRIRSANSRRLASPVSGSWSAWWRSCSCSSRVSATSRALATTPSIPGYPGGTGHGHADDRRGTDQQGHGLDGTDGDGDGRGSSSVCTALKLSPTLKAAAAKAAAFQNRRGVGGVWAIRAIRRASTNSPTSVASRLSQPTSTCSRSPPTPRAKTPGDPGPRVRAPAAPDHAPARVPARRNDRRDGAAGISRPGSGPARRSRPRGGSRACRSTARPCPAE
jgi:hypothetical protein